METPSDNEPGKFPGSQALTDTGASPPDPDRPIEEGRRVSSGRGGSWVSEAWRMFKDAPGSWVACFLIFVIIMIVLAIIPILGNIVGALISPFLVAGMMIGCRELERNEELQVGHLFAGFKENTGPLLVLGLLEFGLSLVAMLIAAGLILVREAGGFVTDLEDNERTMEAGDIIAGNDILHRGVLELIRGAANE